MQTKTAGSIKKPRKGKQLSSYFICVLVIVLTLYVLYSAVDQQIQISNLRTEIAAVKEQQFTQEQKNKELKKVADAVEKKDEKAYKDYVEKVAREKLDLGKNGELVFVNVPGQ